MKYKGLHWGKAGWEILKSDHYIYYFWNQPDVYLEKFAYKGHLIRIWCPGRIGHYDEELWVKRIQQATADQILEALVPKGY